jgi:hypothetical protein
MYSYTAVHLEQKTFRELKSIARDMALVPLGDRRCRQNWVDVIVGASLPLLKLLEVSPVVEVEPVVKPIEVQRLEAIKIEIQEQSIESKFGRIMYPKPIVKPIAPVVENSPAVAEGDQNPILTGITFSPGFLALYSPPQIDNIHYQSNANGQLSLLDFEVESVDEPPDPDDFEFLEDFREAIALWDAQHPEPLEISLDSFSEWAPCPDDWYERALSEVLEFSPVIESSSTSNFSIPTFGAAGDRTNCNDEPPSVGVGARLPKPKPPSFPSMGIVVGDRSNIKKFARSSTLFSGRAPPGGDV